MFLIVSLNEIKRYYRMFPSILDISIKLAQEFPPSICYLASSKHSCVAHALLSFSIKFPKCLQEYQKKQAVSFIIGKKNFAETLK